jgi:hypothetical protein
MKSISKFILGMGLLFGFGGCDKPIKQEEIVIKIQDPLAGVKSVLQRYVDGNPMGSEITSFPGLIDSVRQADPAKADLLKAGFAELEQAKGPALKAKAKELLGKLGS